MGKYLARRTLAIIPLLAAVAVLSFGLGLLLELRGSAARIILGDGASDPQAVADMEKRLGLDRPVPNRFASWLGNAMTGDLGTSVSRRRVPVTELIGDRLWPTLSITLFAMIIASSVGIALGILSGLRPAGGGDRVLSVLTAVLMSTPGFVVGIILMIVFAVRLGWFEPTGYSSPGTDGWISWLRSITLPSIALALPIIAGIQRQLRGSLVGVLQSRYILAARARGVPRSAVVRRHATRNAMIPTVTVIGFWASSAIGLTVAVEQVFNVPGMGTLMVNAVRDRDVPVLQGVLLCSALVVAVVNVVVDLSYGWLNPKVRIE